LGNSDSDFPIIIPKRGSLVATEVLMDALDKAHINNAAYFDLLKKT
jgi:hypothetical protein